MAFSKPPGHNTRTPAPGQKNPGVHTAHTKSAWLLLLATPHAGCANVPGAHIMHGAHTTSRLALHSAVTKLKAPGASQCVLHAAHAALARPAANSPAAHAAHGNELFVCSLKVPGAHATQLCLSYS